MARKIRTLTDAGRRETISVLGETNGGTGQSGFATGDILYSDGFNSLNKLPIGTDGYVLTSVGGVPVWATPVQAIGDTIDIITLGRLDVLTPNSTRYLLPNFSEALTDDFVGYLIDGYGEISNLRVDMNIAPGLGESVVFTVTLNGVDTTLAVTVSNTDTTTLNNSVAISVEPGDRVSLKAVSSALSTATDIQAVIKYSEEPEVVGDDIIDVITVGKIGIITPNAVRYLLPNFAEATTENFKAYIIEEDGYIDNLYVYADTAPGLGENINILIRVNETNTSLTTTLSNTNNYSSNLVNAVGVLNGDRITVRSTTSAGVNASDMHVVCRFFK